MCGIIVIIRRCKTEEAVRKLREDIISHRKLIQHRGPDYSGLKIIKTDVHDVYIAFAHERLVIVDPESGEQPLTSFDGRLTLAVNGEIYNHAKLRKELYSEYPFRTKSDCEVILPWYISSHDYISKKHIDNYQHLDGMFAFALWDNTKKLMLVARDQIGIIPLYIGEKLVNMEIEGYEFKEVVIASEMKVLEKEKCDDIRVFQPGSYNVLNIRKNFMRYSEGVFIDYIPNIPTEIPTCDANLEVIRKTLENAVKKQLMCDVPYGVLLSGGLDSSLIASIAAKFSRMRVESEMKQEAYFPRLHSFSIGLDPRDSNGNVSPDLYFAKKVAKHINSEHHQFTFTLQEAIDALSDVVYMTETYDTTTIRASTPMFLLARRIKSMGIKMVLSGEGADEMFGGYLYFHKAPTPRAFYEETVEKMKKLHLYDCLRANKSTSAWGVEVRPPFLDIEFTKMVLNMHPKYKMITKEQPMEKFVLRNAFSYQPDCEKPDYQPYEYLPKSILFRQKEQFSDGVGYNWITHLKEYTDKIITDEMLSDAPVLYPIHTPKTKEAYYYRQLFAKHFTSDSAAKTVAYEDSIACSTATALEWDESFKKCADQSGRAVANVHENSWLKK